MKKLLLAICIIPSCALAQETPIAPTSPAPILSNMVGQIAGELAATQARLQDANVRIQQLEQSLKDAKAQPSKHPAK